MPQMDEGPEHRRAVDRAAIRRLAHDFTNQFGVIRNYVDLLEEDLGDPSRIREDLASIREAAVLGLELIERLVALVDDEVEDRGER